MSVETILAKKGRDVVTVRPDATLADASKTLSQHGIGAAVVLDGAGAVIGIVSERDVVRAVAKAGGAVLTEPVSRYMTGKVVTCTPAASIDEVMTTMTERKFRHLPVVEHGRLGGIVSIGDVVKHRLADIEAEHRALRDYIATA